MPTSGPSRNGITGSASNNQNATPEINIVDLDNQTAQALYQKQKQQYFSELENRNGYHNIINSGDILDITVWEAAPAVLFGNVIGENGSGTPQLSRLPEQTVSTGGTVSIPFLGLLRVAGKTPEAVQNELNRRLSRMANKPQTIVRIIQNHSANVTVIRQGKAVRMPLTSNGERVLDAVAAVGGINERIQDTTVQLTRGKNVKSLSFEYLIKHPNQNITLQAGDVLTMMHNPYSFTALGAVGNNKEIYFSASGISLAEALARTGGLLDNRSDARGVFVFRYQPFEELPESIRPYWHDKGYDYGMEVPTVYRVDLTDPEAMFRLQRFPMRNKDMVYVANAPLSEFQKFLRLIYSVTAPITSTINSINDLRN